MLSKYYKIAVIYPALFLFPVTLVCSIIINKDYASEWISSGDAVVMDLVAGFLYCLIMILLSFPIFLNNNHKVRSNRFLSCLCWFLIPGALMGLVFGKALNEHLTVGTVGELMFAFIFNLPFVAGLVWGYYRYRRSIFRLGINAGLENQK